MDKLSSKGMHRLWELKGGFTAAFLPQCPWERYLAQNRKRICYREARNVTQQSERQAVTFLIAIAEGCALWV
ncbi:hypothetical protein Thi970DRAFT_02066 [Thiorhodovibrio frisius]|uniref:Uncharacterized protein n=1 Tax=Thiorhodovibrio frisius TaxID=631362 RepID=H8Z3C5_9GAMM|nr:hypothetical protein Thi970DRAFT_02066 [Thiorhodovibrio frisius]WPL21801.1 hypothetical protein Thiofri_01935 [Thiorhodovibrio frisius]